MNHPIKVLYVLPGLSLTLCGWSTTSAAFEGFVVVCQQCHRTKGKPIHCSRRFLGHPLFLVNAWFTGIELCPLVLATLDLILCIMRCLRENINYLDPYGSRLSMDHLVMQGTLGLKSPICPAGECFISAVTNTTSGSRRAVRFLRRIEQSRSAATLFDAHSRTTIVLSDGTKKKLSLKKEWRIRVSIPVPLPC